MLRAVPYMPLPILLPVTLLSFVLLLCVLRFARDTPTRFLVIAFWLRYMMSAFHFITYQPLAAGLSLNAVASLGVVFTSLFIVKRKYLLRVDSVYLLVFFAVVVASGISNGRILGSANAIIKLLYLFSLAFLSYEAFQRHGVSRVMGLLSASYFIPVVLQAISYVAGPVKATEADGSASYIGGYYHEAAFSVLLVTFLFVVCFARVGQRYSLPAFLIGMVGLLAANYRTSIIAILPSMVTFMICGASLKFRPAQRSAITFIFLAAGLFTLILGAILLGDRFKDIPMLLQNGANFIKPPEEFSKADMKVLSGRAYIWSVYLTPWLRASAGKFLLGFGADSWQDLFHLYAHNTFVSYCYEYGLLGLITFVAILGRTMSSALRLGGVPGLVAVSAVSSFILINMATMPLWQIEGNLLFALILAFIWYRRDSMAVAARNAGPRDARLISSMRLAPSSM